jgi:hypothetical protein
MADFWANRYWTGSYFAERYFGGEAETSGPVYLDCEAVIGGAGELAGEAAVNRPVIFPPEFFGGRRARPHRQEAIKDAIRAQMHGRRKKSISFAAMALLREEEVAPRSVLISAPPTVPEISEAAQSIIDRSPRHDAPAVINAAVAAFDLDEDEEDEMIGRLWFTGKLFAQQ